ncbi:cytochrome P450 1B1 [Alosa pseudoharengus]|uniref:cytochrome P450 1B1 n=1 Tax=Alosa pseudoharengus TaxID=34774 RepID=UPI003F8CE5EC
MFPDPTGFEMGMQGMVEDFIRLSPRNILLAALTLLAAYHLWLLMQKWLNTGNLPGPFPWPIVGNAPQLGSTPHLFFTRMAQKYGNIFQIKLGSRTVVVLNGNTIKEALVKKGVDFAGRPDFTSFKFVSNGKSMAFGDYNEWWRVHRRVAHSILRAFSAGKIENKKAFENHAINEIEELLRVFLKKTAEEGYFVPHQYLVISTANIMSAVCFGGRYTYDDKEFQQVVGRNDKFTRTVGAGSMVDVMPWLQYFPNPIKTLFEQFRELNSEFHDFIMGKVIEHRKTIEPGIIRDMTDACIQALDKGISGSVGVELGKDYVSPTISDIFGASQDTLSTSLQWITLILMRYPEIQTRLQDEVAQVVHRTQLPTIEDQARLPYVMAFIYEVMRFTSFIPLTIPHSTTSDTFLNGYHIPKNTVVFVNQWSSNHDPDKWTQPEVFDPLRFLDKNGALDKDRTSSVLIFSVGKRRCIGEDLSKMYLFLFTAAMVHQCEFKPDPSCPLTMDCDYGLTLKPRLYRMAVSLRDNLDLLNSVGLPQADQACRKQLNKK